MTRIAMHLKGLRLAWRWCAVIKGDYRELQKPGGGNHADHPV